MCIRGMASVDVRYLGGQVYKLVYEYGCMGVSVGDNVEVVGVCE